ncbi:cation diffusion facilitator family transporter [Paenibacillus sp. NPDC056579]|uniref:cation diffusion facilitator family transporter n=1 Tax=Paenibacillus sp. NPDC056579 TaxID=3345871 RepID=UPI00368E7B4B
MSDERYQKARFGAWIGITGNMALAMVTGAIGILSGSTALIADAFHSVSNVIRSAAVFTGLRTAPLPSDKDHPYGHDKAESISTIIVPVLLLVVGLEIAISSARAIYNGVDASPKPIALVAIGIVIVVKEALFQYKYRVSKQLNSPEFMASSREHRSDLYSSLAALAGIVGALAGNYPGYTYLYYLDPIAGLFVAGLVLRTGYTLVKESIRNTMDRVLYEEDSAELIETVQEIKGVIAVDGLRAREQGHYVIVDVKISVNPRITVHEGQDIAKQAKQALMKRFTHVTDVVIHVNPYDAGYPYKNNMDSDQNDLSSMLH